MEARGGQRIEAGLEGDARDTPTLGTVVRPHEVDAPTALDAAGDAAARPALPGRGPARMLLVLDDEVLAGVVELALAHVHGRFRARVAPDAVAATSLLGAWRPHLAVVDMDLAHGEMLARLG